MSVRASAASSKRTILSTTEVAARFKCHPVTIWRRLKREKAFPRPFPLGPNSLGWYEDEIEAFIAKIPRRSYA
jgi:predicted DNA-binding transcriptional regulator AlpA